MSVKQFSHCGWPYCIMFWLLEWQLNMTSMPWCNDCRSNCAKWAKFPAWRGTMVFVASKDPVCKYIAPEAQAHAAWQERTCLVPDQKNSEGESITALGTSKYLRTSARWRSATTHCWPLRLWQSISAALIEGSFPAVLRQQVLRPSIGCPAAVSNLHRSWLGEVKPHWTT